MVIFGEEPRVGGGDLCPVQFEIDYAIDGPPDVIWPPFHGIRVERSGPIVGGDHAPLALDIAHLAPMGRSMAVARQVPHNLHDVNFTRPGVVFTQHPERRPDALPRGQINPRLPLAIGLAEFVAGHHPRGGVVAAAVILFAGRDHEVSTADIGIALAVGVVLQLAVAPTPEPLRSTGSEVVVPLAVVDRGPVELIAPREGPRLGTGVVDQGQQNQGEAE